MSELQDDLELLKQSPTTERWFVELQRITEGVRDSQIERLGGAAEVVDVILAGSSDRGAARAALIPALDLLLRSTVLDPISQPLRTYALLDMILEFLPLMGFNRSLELLRKWGSTAMKVEAPHGGIVDLHRVALTALERYYPTPPLQADTAFKSYVDMLRDHVALEGYRGYALQRLLQLSVLHGDDVIVKRLIANDVTLVAEVLAGAFGDSAQLTPSSLLREVYEACRLTGTEAAFASAIQAVGGRVVIEGGAPLLIIGNRKIRLDARPVAERWATAKEDLTQKLDDLASHFKSDA